MLINMFVILLIMLFFSKLFLTILIDLVVIIDRYDNWFVIIYNTAYNSNANDVNAHAKTN